jgi:hypothetical protein
MEVKSLIREMKLANFSHKEICDRLGFAPRPRKATWRSFPWPEAWKRKQGCAAKWISKVR